MGERAPNAALVLTVPATPRRKEDKYVVVCLEDGVPVIDVLCNEVDARNALGGEDRPLWSDNPVAYPNCAPADFGWLAAAGDRAARVQPMPVNPWPLMVAAGMASTSLAAGLLVQHLHRVDVARQAVAAARAADPAPRYLAALAAEQPHMAADRATLVAAARDMFGYRTWIPGWRLSSAQCKRQGRAPARATGCVAAAASRTCARRCPATPSRCWCRKAASYRRSTWHAPRGRSRSRAARCWIRTVPCGRCRRPSPRPARSFKAGAHRGRRDRSEEACAVAACGRRARHVPAPGGPSWPEDVDMHDIPGPFIVEALNAAPAFVSWESVRVDLGEGSDARGLLKFSATGVFYVASR